MFSKKDCLIAFNTMGLKINANTFSNPSVFIFLEIISN